jgi:hypothetical protein
MKPTQNDLILSHLQSGKTLTQLECTEIFLCTRLGARIWDLRHQGHNIQDVGSKNYSIYKLISGEVQAVEASSPMCLESTGEGERTHGAKAVNSEPTPSPVFYDTKKKSQQIFAFGDLG